MSTGTYQKSAHDLPNKCLNCIELQPLSKFIMRKNCQNLEFAQSKKQRKAINLYVSLKSLLKFLQDTYVACFLGLKRNCKKIDVSFQNFLLSSFETVSFLSRTIADKVQHGSNFTQQYRSLKAGNFKGIADF